MKDCFFLFQLKFALVGGLGMATVMIDLAFLSSSGGAKLNPGIYCWANSVLNCPWSLRVSISFCSSGKWQVEVTRYLQFSKSRLEKSI